VGRKRPWFNSTTRNQSTEGKQQYSVQTDNSGFNSPVSSGGKTTAAFGAIVFGSDNKVGGATTSASDSTGFPWYVWAGIAAVAAIYFLRKR
jgi:hypothetical protein